MKHIKENVIDYVYGVQSPCGIKLVEGNRVIDYKHVNEIITAIKNGEHIPPILIDDSKNILDGQHRFMAYCELWRRGFDYTMGVQIVETDKPLLEAIKCNSTRKNWKTADYVNAYISDKRISYIRLQNFCNEHNLKYKAAAQLLTRKDNPNIPTGLLDITEEDVKRAEVLYREIAKISETINDTNLFKDSIILVWFKIRDIVLMKYKFSKFLDILSKKFTRPDYPKSSLYHINFLMLVSK